jgi:hypothetical protein
MVWRPRINGRILYIKCAAVSLIKETEEIKETEDLKGRLAVD